jgi:thiamine pyrophosphate-dependent acetolactate synthase large subunit-like protein
MEYQALPPMDVFMAATSDAVVNELLEALGPGKKAPWKERVASKHRNADGDAVTLEGIAGALRAEFNDPDKVTFCLLNRGWPSDLWPFRSALAYLGKDGGGGLGSGPGLSVGSAVALAEIGRYAVSVLGDGDFCMGATAIWTAVKHRIPLLVLIDNNRSYFNDELHQESVAKTRGRDPRNRWIGLRMEDPMPDIATLAKGQGAVGIGPVTKATDVRAALERGVGVLKQGGVAVVDFHVDPGEERLSAVQSRHPYDK